jgi:hypothetical protein
MTVTTVDAVVARMVFVAELHGLLFFDVATGQIRRPRDLRVNVARHARQNNGGDHTDSSDIICAFMKKLCHFLFLRIQKTRLKF